MNRRKFLSGLSTNSLAVSTVALSASWPDLIRRAFAEPPAKAEAHEDLDGLAVVSEGYRRAQRTGKPLLVFIIPADDSAKWRRGRAFGAWINHGSDAQLWPLSLCEVVCAKLDDLRRLVPSVGLGDPLMILVETDAVPATVTRLDAKLPDIDYAGGRRGGSLDDWQQRERMEDELVDSHIATLARLASKAVCGSPATLARRAAQARTALTPAQLDELAHADPPVPVLDRGAAVIAAGESPARRNPRLAGAVKARLGRQRVPGSHWASSMGCGTHIEGHPDFGRGIMCGMGHVPEKCSRFLYFYTIPAPGPAPGQKDDGTIL